MRHQTTIQQAPGNRRLYTLEGASRELGGISVWTLRKHVAAGNIQLTRIGRRVFINAAELDRIQQEGLPSLPSPPKKKPVSEG